MQENSVSKFVPTSLELSFQLQCRRGSGQTNCDRYVREVLPRSDMRFRYALSGIYQAKRPAWSDQRVGYADGTWSDRIYFFQLLVVSAVHAHSSRLSSCHGDAIQKVGQAPAPHSSSEIGKICWFSEPQLPSESLFDIPDLAIISNSWKTAKHLTYCWISLRKRKRGYTLKS